MKKYLITLALALALATTLAACGSNTQNQPTTGTNQESTTNTDEENEQQDTAEDTEEVQEGETEGTVENNTSTQKPAQDSTQKPAQGSTQKPAQDSTQKPAQDPAQKPGQDPSQQPAEDTETTESDLASVLETVTANVADLPKSWSQMLDSSNFEFSTFIPYKEGYQAINGDAMVGSIAHSVVIVQVPDGEDAAQVAADMEENANPSKWICVTAESVQSASNGNYAILVMSTQAIADAIIANFNAM